MSIELNHTIIPCSDKVISSNFYVRILNFEAMGKVEKFHGVKVNEKLTLLFDYQDDFNSVHLAFKVDETIFDTIFKNVKKEKLLYGSDPYDLENKKINKWHGGRGFYFRDPNGHILELLTKERE